MRICFLVEHSWYCLKYAFEFWTKITCNVFSFVEECRCFDIPVSGAGGVIWFAVVRAATGGQYSGETTKPLKRRYASA